MDRPTFIALGGCSHCWPEDRADEPTAHTARFAHPLPGPDTVTHELHITEGAGAPLVGVLRSTHGTREDESPRTDPDEPELVTRALYGDR